MKQFNTYIIIILLAILIIPSVALAAWWNPMSWHIWNIFNIFSRPQSSKVQQQTINTAKPNQPTIPQTSIDQTDGWKTYTNTQYVFSFKYPSNWPGVNISINGVTSYASSPLLVDYEDSHLSFENMIGQHEVPGAKITKFNISGKNAEEIKYSLNVGSNVGTIYSDMVYIDVGPTSSILVSGINNQVIDPNTFSNILASFKFGDAVSNAQTTAPSQNSQIDANAKTPVMVTDTNQIPKDGSAYIYYTVQNDNKNPPIQFKVNGLTDFSALQYGQPFTVSWNAPGMNYCIPTSEELQLKNGDILTLPTQYANVDSLQLTFSGVYHKNQPVSFSLDCVNDKDGFSQIQATLGIPFADVPADLIIQ